MVDTTSSTELERFDALRTKLQKFAQERAVVDSPGDILTSSLLRHAGWKTRSSESTTNRIRPC